MKIKLFLLSILVPFISYGQDTINTKYNFELTGIHNSVNGNARTTLTMLANNSVSWKKFESSVSTEYQLVSNDGVNSVNDFTVKLQPRIVDKKYSIFSFGQLSSLESKKISQRFEGGIGAGYNVIYKPNFGINLSYATLFYNNNFDNLTNRNGLRHSPRYVIWGKLPKHKITYSSEAYFQPSFIDYTDYILRTKHKVGLNLSDKFTISLNYSTWFESYFVQDATNDVKTFTIGTSYKFE